MATGRVKFASELKGFGFIVPDGDDKREVYFRLRDARDRLDRGDFVMFDLVDYQDSGKRSAFNVALLD
jgi:cold shock CspA family protein